MSSASSENLNAVVRKYWEAGPCGTLDDRLQDLTPGSREWFDQIEEIRYSQESMIFAAAQFTRFHGKKVLEIGVGAGTDHLQWARAGAELHGVDLTDAAIETTRQRLSVFGLSSHLQVTNAETLPFADGTFDVVYSWGVIHHSEDPARIVREVYRVLRPGGRAITMFYSKHSVRTWKYWLRYGLLKGKIHWGIRDVMWHHMESLGTKCYTPKELREIFGSFGKIEVRKYCTPYDLTWIPQFLHRYVPDGLGFFSVVKAQKLNTR